MDKTAIVILNWNGLDYLKKFLGNVVARSGQEGNVIYLADNNSSDGSVDWVEKNLPSVRIIKLDSNYGFAGGYNKALERITAKYYILINSDIEVTKGWIDHLASFMDNNPDVASCQPKILSWHNREYFEYAGAAGGYIDRYGFPFCRGRVFSSIEKDEGQYDTVKDVFWTSGACMMVRSDAWHKCGALDPDFFAHMEEIDLCWRFLLSGYRLSFVPESVVYHVGGGALPYDSPYKTYLNFRNNLFLLYKNLPDEKLRKTLFSRMLLDGVAAIRYLFTGKLKNVRAIWRSHVDYYRNIESLKVKRESIARTSPEKPFDYILNKSLVFQFYIKGRKTFSLLRTNF